MKEKNAAGKTFFVVVNSLLLFFVVIMIFQLNSIEKRFIALSAKMASIERRIDSSSRRSVSVPSAQTSLSSTESSSGRKYLHPKVKNFLSDETFSINTPETQPGGVLRRWYPSEPKSFNYIVSNDGELATYIGRYVFGEELGIRSYMEPDKWVKGIAERIEITNDYKTYTVYLKQGIKWHTPQVDWNSGKYEWLKGDHYVTAHDVKFALDIINNPQVEAPQLRNYYSDYDSCKVLDDYTIIINWKKKTYNSVGFTVGLSPLPEFIYAYDEDGKRFPKEIAGLKFNNHWYNTKPIGFGPYEFVSYETGSSIKLRRFEDYYGEKPAIDEIHYSIYPDQKQNLYKLKSHTQDFGILYPTDYREEIINGKAGSDFKNGNIRNKTYTEMNFSYIGWNMEKTLFKDKKVRWALSHALNMDYILKNIFMDLGIRISGPLFVNSSAYDKKILPVKYDLDASRRLLAEAGWKDSDGDGILDKVINDRKVKFEFTLLSPSGSPEWAAAENIYKEDLMKLGIKMNISSSDWAVFQKRIEDKDFDAMTGGWGLAWEQDPYQLWHSSQASIPKSSNHISYRSPQADKVIEELRSTFDPDKRMLLYHKFHRIIYEDQPYTFLMTRKRCAVWWKNLDNVVFSPMRPHSISLPWYFKNEQIQK